MDLKEDGSFKLNMKFFDYATGLTMTNKKFSKLFGNPVRNPKKDLLKDFHMDIAASIQAVTEEVVIRLTRNIASEFMFSWRGCFKLCGEWKNIKRKDF